MTFTPSKYQQATFDFIEHDLGNGVVIAVAGSGKTTTMAQAMNLPSLAGKRVIALAFNKHSAEDMKKRLPNWVESATCHSIGNRFVRNNKFRAKMNQYAVNNVVEPLLSSIYSDRNERSQAIDLTCKVVSLIKGTLTDPFNQSAVIDMINQYDIELNSHFDAVLSVIPATFHNLAVTQDREYDFDDMIYLPVKHGWVTADYDYVFVDEAQDLNRAQIEFCKALSVNGRIIAVGDPQQSIYAFRGADHDAIPNLIRDTHATTLPLSICYRCPTSHIELAKVIVPQIEAAPGAVAGTVTTATYDALLGRNHFQPNGHLVLCRTNAPLVSFAYRMISANIPTIVRGRDIGKSIVTFIRKLTKNSNVLAEKLVVLAGDYHIQELKRLVARNAPESTIQSLDDRIETLYALTEGMRDCNEVTKRVESLFQDISPSNAVVASSVHRAKGLEANDVTIIRPDLLPMRFKNQSAAQAIQEQNIKYVALTRSKATLTFATED